jgi:hypothetical protein
MDSKNKNSVRQEKTRQLSKKITKAGSGKLEMVLLKGNMVKKKNIVEEKNE